MQIHKIFADNVKAMAASGLPFGSEVSYKDHFLAYRGQWGSVRADAIYGSAVTPRFVLELKTGGAMMYRADVIKYNDNIPYGTKIIQLRIP